MGVLPVGSGSGGVRESPMKVATVKRALTLTMASRAVTWTLVVVDDDGVRFFDGGASVGIGSIL